MLAGWMPTCSPCRKWTGRRRRPGSSTRGAYAFFFPARRTPALRLRRPPRPRASPRTPISEALDLQPRPAIRFAAAPTSRSQVAGRRLRLLSMHLEPAAATRRLEPQPGPIANSSARQAEVLARLGRRRGRREASASPCSAISTAPRAAAMTCCANWTRPAPLTRATRGLLQPLLGRRPRRPRPSSTTSCSAAPARAWLVPRQPAGPWSMPSAAAAWRERLSDHCPVSLRLRLP